MKKVTSLLLSVILLISLAVPVTAASEDVKADYDGYPIVVVRGIDFGGFYLEDKSPAISFELKDIFSFIKNYFVQLIIEKSEDAFLDSSFALVSEILGPITVDREGKPVYEVFYDRYPESMDHYLEEVPLMDDIGETGIIKTAIDTVGAENVYYFTYDWRKSAAELADDLNSYIENVLDKADTDKVNITAVSMGGMVTTAYLNYHGADSLNNLVYVSSAHNGTYGPGDAFNGEIYFDSDVIYNNIRKSFGGSVIKCFFLDVIDRIGVFDAVTAVANKIVEDNPQTLDNEALRDGFGTLLGLWAMCPDEIYDSGVDFMYGGHEDEYSVIMEKLSATREFIFSTEDAIENAIDSGVNVSFISNYNTPLAPYFKHSYLQGDGVLETVLTSNFATVAPYGEELSSEYLAEADSEYVSPDRMVDATGALYRDTTWFVKDAVHVAAKYGSEFADFVMWLVLAEEQPTVKSDSRYPQFMSVDSDMNFITE